MFSILLIGGKKIDITPEQVAVIRKNIDALKFISVGNYTFPASQIALILPKGEADFLEKMELRTKGFYRCKRGTIHKIGDGRCDCSEIGEIDPRPPQDSLTTTLDSVTPT